MANEPGHDHNKNPLRSNVINQDNHAAIVTITTALLLTCVLLFYICRLFTRWPLHALFGRDDAVITIATLLAIGQSATMFLSASSGLGKHISRLSEAEIAKTYKIMFAGDILYVLALSPAKLGSSLLIDRITRFTERITAPRIISLVIVLWSLIAVIVVAWPCDHTNQPGKEQQYACPNSMARWTGITATSLAMELALLSLPVYVVWGVPMSLSAKFVVLLAFWSRLPIFVISILRLRSLQTALLSSDATFDLVMPQVYTQLDLQYHILAAFIATLNPFLRVFNSGFLATASAQVPKAPPQPSTSAPNQKLIDAEVAKSLNSAVEVVTLD